jgi:hypothetical protein
MDDLIKDMQNKGLIEVRQVCKYRGARDLREFLKLFDKTHPIEKLINQKSDNIYPIKFELDE